MSEEHEITSIFKSEYDNDDTSADPRLESIIEEQDRKEQEEMTQHSSVDKIIERESKAASGHPSMEVEKGECDRGIPIHSSIRANVLTGTGENIFDEDTLNDMKYWMRCVGGAADMCFYQKSEGSGRVYYKAVFHAKSQNEYVQEMIRQFQCGREHVQGGMGIWERSEIFTLVGFVIDAMTNEIQSMKARFNEMKMLSESKYFETCMNPMDADDEFCYHYEIYLKSLEQIHDKLLAFYCEKDPMVKFFKVSVPAFFAKIKGFFSKKKKEKK